jgi:hypothetical protein
MYVLELENRYILKLPTETSSVSITGAPDDDLPQLNGVQICNNDIFVGKISTR